MSLSDLARALDRGESTVRERVLALERSGVVQGYCAVVSASSLGLKARAMIRAECDVGRAAEIGKRLATIPNVVRCFLSTGTKPLRIEVIAEDTGALTSVIERRVAGPDLHNMEVGIFLQEMIPMRALPVPVPPGVVRVTERPPAAAAPNGGPPQGGRAASPLPRA